MKLFIALLLVHSMLFSMSAKPKIYQDYHITGLKTTEQAMTPQIIEKALQQAGITVVATEDLNRQFIKQYQTSAFKHYSIITCYNKEISDELLRAHPNAGLFYSTRVVIFQKKEDPILWVALLSSRTMGKVLTLKKREKLLADYDRSILRPIIKSMKKSRFKQVNSSQLRQLRQLVLHKKEIASLQEITVLEKKLSQSALPLIRIMDLNKALGESSPYEFYKSYHFRSLHTLYTKSIRYPESAAHTPLHLVIYKQKGASHVTITQVDTAHVIDSSDITETESLRALSKDQKAIEDLIQSLLK